MLKTGGKLSTATLPLLRVELSVLYIDSTDGASKPTYAVCHVRCALSLRIAELLVMNMLCVVSAACGHCNANTQAREIRHH